MCHNNNLVQSMRSQLRQKAARMLLAVIRARSARWSPLQYNVQTQAAALAQRGELRAQTRLILLHPCDLMLEAPQ